MVAAAAVSSTTPGIKHEAGKTEREGLLLASIDESRRAGANQSARMLLGGIWRIKAASPLGTRGS
jgi:hypothetical protein